jgi:hypothetical protein
MAVIEKILGDIQSRQVKEAVEGLQRPLSKDAYELGRLTGIQQGLAIALGIVNEVIGEDEQKSNKTVPRR